MRKNLKEARRRAGMTQKQMADFINTSLIYYQKIEAGDRTGGFEIWDALEELFNIHQRKKQCRIKYISTLLFSIITKL